MKTQLHSALQSARASVFVLAYAPRAPPQVYARHLEERGPLIQRFKGCKKALRILHTDGMEVGA